MAEAVAGKDQAALAGCLMTIFGASGDLTKRLLLPSVYNLAAAKILPDSFRVLGVAMDDWDEAKFRQHIAESLKQFWGPDAQDEVMQWLASRASYQMGNFDQPESFQAVKAKIEGMERESGSGGNRLFYLAVAPSFIATVTALLSGADLLREDGGCWRRLVIEKPFGHDLASAIELNASLQKSLREEQIYRIDHFAGKDAVQDLAVFRFSNAIMEPLWNRSLVDHVQITVAETVGVESRAAFYEKSGALRDMVPNHLAEVLSLIAMEPPVSLSAEHMRDKQVELLASVRQIKREEVAQFAVRGQYGAGQIALGGNQAKDVVGYQEEPGVSPDSGTETYVALQVEIDNWRWSGVPFYLRTGKRLCKALTEVVVTFRQPPARLFPDHDTTGQPPNRLFFNMQPKQSIELRFRAKTPGLKTEAEEAAMVFNFSGGPFADRAKGYERLLHDVMAGDSTLFQRAEFVELGWRMVQPLLDAWGETKAEDFPNYAAGSTGPQAADELLARQGHSWHSVEEA
jgi:glucose-6-phosphate 1-dehydrogenase